MTDSPGPGSIITILWSYVSVSVFRVFSYFLFIFYYYYSMPTMFTYRSESRTVRNRTVFDCQPYTPPLPLIRVADNKRRSESYPFVCPLCRHPNRGNPRGVFGVYRSHSFPQTSPPGPDLGTNRFDPTEFYGTGCVCCLWGVVLFSDIRTKIFVRKKKSRTQFVP